MSARTTPSGPAPDGHAILLGVGHLHAGFYLPAPNLRVLSGLEVFDEAEVAGARRTRAAQRNVFLSDFRDLKPGDYVVHVDHGIGQFHGLRNIGLQDGSKEFVLLTYQDDARLYVPVERLDLIQKYSNLGGSRPTLDRLGGTSWERTKTRIKKSMRDMAGELLKLYAERQLVPGFAFSPDSAWQQEFEDAVRVRPDAGPGRRGLRRQARTWRPPARWTGCCAATSATARPKSRCGPPSRR